jgi:hypothetical protein
MLFKPNFCCNCGVKIERAEWSMLTSRRFCEVCAVEYQGHDWLPRAVVIVGVLIGIFGLGSYMGGQGPQQPGVFKGVQNEPEHKLAVGAKERPRIKDEERVSSTAREVPGDAPLGMPSGSDLSKEHPRNLSIASDEPVYYCGAMTKKGTPCSRRVKLKGKRCWQHAGQPSALVSQSTPDVY